MTNIFQSEIKYNAEYNVLIQINSNVYPIDFNVTENYHCYLRFVDRHIHHT